MKTLQALAVCLLASSWAAQEAIADRASVELALAEMERAVLAGDAAAYMAQVDRRGGDANFVKEQENWSADFKRHIPKAFTLRIGPKEEDREEVFGEREARFELEIAWTMTGLSRSGKDIEKTVSFPVRFVLDDAGGKWLYAGEDWLVLETNGVSAREASGRRKDEPKDRSVRVKYFAGYDDVARTITEILPDVREHVDAGFELSIDRVQEVKIYPTMPHLQQSIYLSYVDGLSGWNEPGEAIKIKVRPDAGKAGLRSLLAHEYGHVATFELGPKATDMPWWALEGVAELAAETYAQNETRVATRVRGWLEEDNLAPWAEIADFHNTPRKFGGHVYTQGHAMVGYISERYGRGKRNAWLRAMAQGQSIDDASRSVLGAGFEEVDRAWRAEIAKQIELEQKKTAPQN